jgi:hypothetical protein
MVSRSATGPRSLPPRVVPGREPVGSLPPQVESRREVEEAGIVRIGGQVLRPQPQPELPGKEACPVAEPGRVEGFPPITRLVEDRARQL